MGLDFTSRILDALVRIPAGRVSTYAELASSVSSPRHARAAGNALKKNLLAPGVPCHRIIRSDGRVGGYSARGGVGEKIRLLRSEGIRVTGGRVEGLSAVLFRFPRREKNDV